MGRVIHFEIATAEPAREIEFLKSVFDWDISGWGDEQYWLVDTGKYPAGINGAIMPKRSPEQPPVVNTIDVENLDDSMAKAIAAGATVAMGKQEVPNIGWTAYMLSPTGIMFGMIESMPGAGM